MRVAVHKPVTRSPAVRPAAAVHVLQPATLRRAPVDDPAEREARETARNVVRMPLPASAAHRLQTSVSNTESGNPLPAAVRTFMEPRLGADLGAVRVHTGPQAARLNREINARAFTVGNHVYFGEGRYRPESAEGLELIAHELTHTVQQQSSPVRVQRLGLDDVLDGLAELAANVPGFTLLTLIIGRNPINMRAVERTLVNLLRGFMGLVPGGEILFQVLEHYGVVTRLGNWLSQQAENAGLSFAGIRDAFTRFTDGLGWRDIFSPADVWRRARDVFGPPLARLRDIAAGMVRQAITWLKETFMQPLADFCREIPGYSLVTVMLGRDPFTDAPVARTPLNVVRAVAEFIPGGRERVDQLVESRALERAYTWFMDETRARNLTWERVTGTFATAWNSLQLEDVLSPIDTLRRMVNLFRPLLSDLAGFAGAALMKLAELIFEAAMGAGGARVVAIFRRARDTFNVIIADPVRFLRNLLSAVGQGVRQFMGNILTHLRDGVIAWLAGPVARSGIQIPEQWDLRGIIWFILQILGLSWARVRQKLVRLMGERTVSMLEAGFQLIVDIRERGLVQALRDRVSEFFGNLREAALGAIRSFIQQRLVMAGIQQLLSLLSPVGAVIQAIIKTYNTVMFFIQRINEILELVESIVNSIAAIAAGAIGSAANFVERTMARTIPIILDFLARFIGLGDVGAQVQNTIRSLQARVDQMLDRAVDWIRRQAASLASRALGGDPNAPAAQRLQAGLREGAQAVNRLSGSRIGVGLINPVLAAIRVRNSMRSLSAQPRGTRWAVVGEVNPTGEELTEKLVDTTTAGAEQREYDGVNASGFGTGARVTGLRGLLAQNSPSATNDAWSNKLSRRLNRHGGSTYYVRGHLINGTFGGPGSDWRNLTPLTQAANNRSIQSMLRTFESPVRDAVRANGSADLSVRAVYGQPNRSADAQRARASGNPAGDAIAQIIEAEQQVPSEIQATARIVAADGSVSNLSSNTDNVVDTSLVNYFHADHPPATGDAGRRLLNLNSASRTELMGLVGVTAAVAQQIENGRPYTDRDGFIARMGASGPGTWHSMMSTAGVSLRF